MTNTMKSVQNMGYESYLTKDYQAGTDTTITVYDGTKLPSAPNSICISSLNNEDSVIVKYNAISGNVLTIDTITHSSRPGAETTKYVRGCIVYKEFSDTISGGGGGSGGTSDYNLLSNKPQINGVQLQGNKTPGDIGAVKTTGWNPNKYLGTDASGAVVEKDGASGSVSFSQITGEPKDNKNLSDALAAKVNLSTTSEKDFSVGVDSSGNAYLEY